MALSAAECIVALWKTESAIQPLRAAARPGSVPTNAVKFLTRRDSPGKAPGDPDGSRVGKSLNVHLNCGIAID